MNSVETEEVGETADHGWTHRDLLPEVPIAKPARIDAIIVPTARPAAYLRAAVKVAREQDCILVALCSKLASAEQAFALAQAENAQVLAVDIAAVPRVSPDLLPPFGTSAFLRGTRFARRTDTSMKRNFGLVVAQIAGWKRILFLDDDISVPRSDDLNNAAGLLANYDAVGLHVAGYPDNSVVCHANRDSGGQQDTFIGGGALAVGRRSFTTSFFPNIYNEDWFFLLDGTRLRPSALTGTVIQKPYDPYRNTERALLEELGDTLAEGLFALLDERRELTCADAGYWADYLTKRRDFIDRVLDRTLTARLRAPLHEADRGRIIAALKAARGRSLLITPGFCAGYLHAWRQDRVLWHEHMASVTRRYRRNGLEKLLADIGFRHYYRSAA